MKSHYHCVYDLKYHLVIVTKYRRKCFTEAMIRRLNEICLELCQKWEIELLEFGAEEDHIHLLLEMNPTVQISKFVNNIKTVTSRYLRKEFSEYLKQFYWEPVLWTRAYYISTVGGAPLATVKEYIQNQERPDK
jgi:putative transposase